MRTLVSLKTKGFTIIEVMIAVMIIGVLAAIALNNMLSYRSKAYCSGVEQDSLTVRAALSCYFAEPNNTTCSGIDNLINDKDCGFSIQGENVASLLQIGSGGAAYWKIMVTDGSTRCPRGRAYYTYIGTSLTAHWEWE